MSRVSPLVIVMALVAAACNGVVATSSTSSTTTSMVRPPSTVSTLVSTTTTMSPSALAPDWYWPEQQPRSGGAEGSGCAPGSDQLPDGYWFGMVTAYSAEDITFDLACWFSDEDEPNGYRIRNDNAALRTIAVADGAEAWRIDLDFELGLAPPIPFSDWVPETANFIVCPGESCLVWIHTEGGVVCELVEQYTP